MKNHLWNFSIRSFRNPQAIDALENNIRRMEYDQNSDQKIIVIED